MNSNNLPEQEDDVEQLSKLSAIALEEYEKKFDVKLRGLDVDIWKSGWIYNQRAASKKYSEEDMEKIYWLSKNQYQHKDKSFSELLQCLSPTLNK